MPRNAEPLISRLSGSWARFSAGTAGAVLSYDLRAPARLTTRCRHPRTSRFHTSPARRVDCSSPAVPTGMRPCACETSPSVSLRLRWRNSLRVRIDRPRSPRSSGTRTWASSPSGSSERAIKLWISGRNFATISYTNSFLGQAIGSVTTLAFHPNSLYLAAGSNANSTPCIVTNYNRNHVPRLDVTTFLNQRPRVSISVPKKVIALR